LISQQRCCKFPEIISKKESDDAHEAVLKEGADPKDEELLDCVKKIHQKLLSPLIVDHVSYKCEL
jgi:hypothetical protein